MHESDNEILARAYETLERANRTLQQRDPVAEPEPIANWRGCTTTQEMTTSQFDQWCRDGKPVLVTRDANVRSHLPTMTKAKVADMVRAAIDRERTNTQATLEAVAEILGEEVAVIEKRVRADFEAKLDALRAEISRGVGSDDPLELPNWRADVVQH